LYSYFPASLPENRKSEVFLMGMEQDIQQVLFSEEELKTRVQALGAQITQD
jgi:hypothetical protein